MRDDMKCGDQILFYHSNCKTPGIVGIAEVCHESYPDFTAFDPLSEHPDLTSTPENPRWFMVDIRFVKKLPHVIALDTLKQYPPLASWALLRKGNRLSVLPVSAQEWAFIQTLIIDLNPLGTLDHTESST